MIYMDNNNSSGINTVLLIVILLVVVGALVWFFGNTDQNPADAELNVEMNVPAADSL